MTQFTRTKKNPILSPKEESHWEARAAFNPSVIKEKNKFHLFYRALSAPENHFNVNMSLSSIGYTTSEDGIHFLDRRQLIRPEYYWETYGCEDPRATFLNNKYYIFYTALSTYPFSAQGIKIGLAITKDFQTIEKHPVTTFNSKAMALFPEKIQGKMVAVLTVHTDTPPAKIALAFFDHEEQLWSTHYWSEWYASLDNHVLPLLRNEHDHVEVGAAPVKTDQGWLLIYSYIQHYFSEKKIFGIEAVLLDLHNPSKIIGKTTQALLAPKTSYEKKGDVPNVIFPSGALIHQENLFIYYGAADTTSCLAIGSVNDLLTKMARPKRNLFISSKKNPAGFKRYNQNPIIAPRLEFAWEAKATFNPAAIYEDGKVHIIYRAMSHQNVSVFGYASSTNGMTIDERLSSPIYVPRASYEQPSQPGNSGCEDPRITKINDRFYMLYTAYDGYSPRVAITSIEIDDFLHKCWNWEQPRIISPPNIPDKNACLLPKKINGQYVIFHRVGTAICINMIDDLSFNNEQLLTTGEPLINFEADTSIEKVGISTPPIETEYGWLLLYHQVTHAPRIYQVSAMLLDIDDPRKVISHHRLTLLEPEMNYEKEGQVADVVFPNGAVLLHGEIFLYYGGADKVVGVAKIKLNALLNRLKIKP